MKPVHEMDEDECRDEIAKHIPDMKRADGYWYMDYLKFKHHRLYGVLNWGTCGSVDVFWYDKNDQHPIPATIDAAAASLPEGWEYEIHNRNVGGIVSMRCIPETGHWDDAIYASANHERLARFRCAVAALRAVAEGARDGK